MAVDIVKRQDGKIARRFTAKEKLDNWVGGDTPRFPVFSEKIIEKSIFLQFSTLFLFHVAMDGNSSLTTFFSLSFSLLLLPNLIFLREESARKEEKGEGRRGYFGTAAIIFSHRCSIETGKCV